MKKFFLLILLVPVLSGCVAFVESQEKMAETLSLLDVEYKGTVHKDISYADGLAFDLYLPENLGNPSSGTLFFFVHGGSWTSGAKEDGERWCCYFAALGYTAASLNYSLQTKKATPSIDHMIEEIHQCLSKVVSVSTDYGVTLNEMVLNGYSAGGCLALLYGYREMPELPVRFIATQSAPVSFNPSAWEDGAHWLVNVITGVDGSDKGAAAWLSKMSGEDVTDGMIADGSARPVWERISPIDQLKAGAPPTLIAYGQTDGVVPRGHKDMLIEKLKETATPYEYVLFPHSGHALAFDSDCQKSFLERIAYFCDLYLVN